VVVPSNAYDAKGLFISAVEDPNPVLFIEHRWLYETTSNVPEGKYRVPLGLAGGEVFGEDVTLVASGYAHLEARKAVEFLQKEGVSVDLIDLKTIKPLNEFLIKSSVKRTGRLVVVDDTWKTCGLAAEIIALVCEEGLALKSPPIRVTYPDYPSASSPALTKRYYNGPADIFLAVQKCLGKSLNSRPVIEYQESRAHDVPDQNFRGPF
jgi:pyruvate dehydrogenase E1 component beta subunit